VEIIIRKLLPENAYERASCHVSAWRSAYKGIVPDEYLNNLSIEKRAEKFKQKLQEFKDVLYYCAVYENRIIGFFDMGKSCDEDKPNTGEIYAIYSIEEFWSKGVGRQMMDYAIDTLKHMGYNEIVLWVLEENSRARRFYEKCGFSFDGTKKEITIGKPLIEIRYAINL